MAWQCSGRSNAELIENLYKAGLITSVSVRDAMKKVDRAHYCPNAFSAYEDSPQSIGHAATISAPHMHASATEALLPLVKPKSNPDAEPGIRILDIGSGSGYLTAVLAEVSNPSPSPSAIGGTKVVGLEHISALRDLGEANVRKSDRGVEMLRSGLIEFVVGDGRKGWMLNGQDEEIWDAIHVGAAAITLHESLVRQLKKPGRLFIPVEDEAGTGQWIWVVDKDVDGKVTKKRKEGVRYVPLTDAPK